MIIIIFTGGSINMDIINHNQITVRWNQTQQTIQFVYWRIWVVCTQHTRFQSCFLYISLLQDSTRKWGTTPGFIHHFYHPFNSWCPRILLHLSNLAQNHPARRLQIVVQALFYSQCAFQCLRKSINGIWWAHPNWETWGGFADSP